MTDIEIGTYDLGWERVRLVGVTRNGGCFNLCPKTPPAFIEVNLGEEHWVSLVNILMHETLEMVLTRLHVRYEPSQGLSRDHCQYIFSFNHFQLSEAAYMVAEFVTACLDDLKAAWELSKGAV